MAALNRKSYLVSERVNTIGRLPVELLNESFSYLTTIDLLAIARTSKLLSRIVTDPHSSFVWKRARRNFDLDYPFPDPTPNWTEPALADFLFSIRQCTICEKTVHSPPFSLIFRVSLCDKRQCIEQWATKYTKSIGAFHENQHPLLHALPYLDVPLSSPQPLIHSLTHPNHRRWLTSDCLMEEARFGEMSALDSNNVTRMAYFEELDKRKKKTQKILKWAEDTQRWVWVYCQRRVEVLNHTKSHVMLFAAEQGWDLYKIRFSPTLTSLRRQHERSLIVLSPKVIRRYQHEIEKDLRDAILASYPRKKKALNEFRKLEIKKLYTKLNGRLLFPCKNEFKQFPAIKMIDILEAETIRNLIESGKIMSLLNDNLAAWIRNTRDQFGRKLGHQKWISVSSKTFHPAERADAFFQCKKCRRVPERCAIYGALTFREACRHICGGLSKIKREREVWNSEEFEADQKAVSVARKALSAASCESKFYSAKKFEDLGHLFICKSCPSLIAMNFQSVIGHCKRHDDMQVELVIPDTAMDILQYPIKYGVLDKVRKVKGPEVDKRQFGCRHCGRDSKPKYALHGLISHLKAKHNILNGRDEDVFVA